MPATLRQKREEEEKQKVQSERKLCSDVEELMLNIVGKTDDFVSIKAKFLWNNRFRVNYYTKIEINKICRETISHSWFVVIENNEVSYSSPIIKQLGKPAKRKTVEELIGDDI